MALFRWFVLFILILYSLVPPPKVPLRYLLELETYFPNSSAFFIELEGLQAGYYRIFYDLDTGERLWDNIYIDPSASDFNELLDEVSGDW